MMLRQDTVPPPQHNKTFLSHLFSQFKSKIFPWFNKVSIGSDKNEGRVKAISLRAKDPVWNSKICDSACGHLTKLAVK